MSVRAFCENKGIHENSYYYWQKKLREAACDKMAEINGEAANLAQPVFAQVRLPERNVLSPTTAITQDQICIEAIGVRLTAGGEYPVEKLTELLRAVM
jgi:hypothetical protein